MRKHEIELITALAEGNLEDETEARVLIESSDKARSEYEAQRTAIEALASVPPAGLTSLEKAALHQDVWTELSAGPSTAQKTTPWYYRWSYAAAGLFVVVGLVAVLNINIGSGEDASLEGQITAQEITDETTMAADGGNEAPSFTVESGGADYKEGDEEGTIDPVVEFFREQAPRVRSGQLNYSSSLLGDDQDTIANEYSACLSQADLADYEALGEITFDEAGSYGLDPETPYLIAVPSAAPVDESTPVAFVDLITCSRVYIDE